MFAFASTALLVGVGSGVDLARAYLARQKLSEVATLTCQYAIRPSVRETGGATAAYVAAVNLYVQTALAGQKWSGTQPTDSNGGNAAYFQSTAATGTSNNQEPTGTTQLTFNVPTTFMRIVNIQQIPVHAIMPCQPPTPATSGPSGTVLLQETFDTGTSGYVFIAANGTIGTTATPSSTFPPTAGYQGSSGLSWYITGYCLEVDQAGVISANTPNAGHSAELDCDNGSGTAGNSSISTKTYLPVGYYELRYYYRSRIYYQNYSTSYICGSTASDVSWANDGFTYGGAQWQVRENQLEAYLDKDVNGAAPLHRTIDGTQQLAGSNLIDVCVYNPNWMQRSVKIKITTAGYYWLSFAADGANTSYGGQLDDITLCADSCAGTPQDNFPWTANQLLYESSFESPTVTSNTSYSWQATNGNLAADTGITTNSVCAGPFGGPFAVYPGWNCMGTYGWGVAPYNQVDYYLQGADQGSQYIQLDGSNAFSSGSPTTNRLISRPFLLDPGYYQVSYDYISNVNFSDGGVNYCYAAPASGAVFPSYPTASGQPRYLSSSYTLSGSTNIIGAFMSHGQLVSTPNLPGAPWAYSSDTNFSQPSVGAQTSYTNPDGSVSTTPSTPPDAVNYFSYNASANNPLLDVCGYYDAWKWLARTVSIKITKPGVYWLTFSTNGGTADGYGGGIDDVKLTALGSPYMASPPTAPLVAIPVPNPQPDTDYTGPSGAPFSGFYTVADPFKPTAADQ